MTIDFKMIRSKHKSYLRVPKKFIKEFMPELIPDLLPQNGQDLHFIYINYDECSLDYDLIVRVTTELTFSDKSLLEDFTIGNLRLDDFKVTNNYQAKYFDFKFEVGDKFTCDGEEYTVVSHDDEIIVENWRKKQLPVPIYNPFEYIDREIQNQ